MTINSHKRVLLVGPTPGFKPSMGHIPLKKSGLMFYSFGVRLANGFVRNGHMVLEEDDRDSRKSLVFKFPGAWLANRRLIHIAREFQPDLICLHHCDLITPDTISAVRTDVPHCRVAAIYYDNIVYPPMAARFSRFLEMADFGFATTGGAALARFAKQRPVAFIPNPVDCSIDNVIAFKVPVATTDIFAAIGQSGAANRWDSIDELQKLRPNLRYGLFGREKIKRLLGSAFHREIARSKIGLNLNRYEGDLYASDRMAQFLGSGLLLATSSASGYQRYFDDDEMIFFNSARDLADKIDAVLADDTRWRRMAERGREKALATMAGERVTDFIVSMTLGLGVPPGWRFADHIYLD